VMEVARVMSAPDVVTDRSVRFILWNNEESGLDGA
jgi:Zn-dependent M28 family amino/carboxypeptidase